MSSPQKNGRQGGRWHAVFRIADQIGRVADAIFAGVAEAASWRRNIYPHPPRPKPFTIKLISERRENNVDILTYEADLPPVPPNTDVAGQHLLVTSDGEPYGDQQLDGAATVATFEVPENAAVTLSLTYVDNAGNISAPRTQTFVATDTIPPDAPGEFGEIRLTGERSTTEGEPTEPTAPLEPTG